jgi:hypothetical protein
MRALLWFCVVALCVAAALGDKSGLALQVHNNLAQESLVSANEEERASISHQHGGHGGHGGLRHKTPRAVVPSTTTSSPSLADGVPSTTTSSPSLAIGYCRIPCTPGGSGVAIECAFLNERCVWHWFIITQWCCQP